MSLTLAYNIARGALSTGSAASSVVSRNVANADNPDAARKSAIVATDATGATYLAGIAAEVNSAVLERALESGSARSRLEAVSQSLGQLADVIGDPESKSSPAALIGSLGEALQAAAGAPHDPSTLQSALSAASELVGTLNAAAETTAGIRADASAGVRDGAASLRALLDDFGTANREVVSGSARGRDVTDAIDRRNGLVRQIAGLIEVRATLRDRNDMVLHVANGITLFETSARQISFIESSPIQPGQPGPALRIDGVPVPSDGSVGGRLAGLLVVRDDLSLKFGRQLDEIARGLIAAAAESDQSAIPTGPDLAGLFTYAGGPALPAAATVLDGLAGMLRINPNVDPQQGGLLTRLRDGGISDPGNPAYRYNASASAGFSDRLQQLVQGLSGNLTFDAAAGVAQSPGGVARYAAESAGWLEGARSANTDALEIKSVLADRALGAWQSAVGVNLDDELAALIALERSYQASSRLLSSVTGMFDAILAATR